MREVTITHVRKREFIRLQCRLVLAAAVGALAFGSAACHRRDIESPWWTKEERHFHAASFDLAPPAAHREGDYTIFIPQGVLRHTLALAATESLVVGRDVTIAEPSPHHDTKDLARISSTGRVSIGRRSRLGALYAAGPEPARLEEGVMITQYAKTPVPFDGTPPPVGVALVSDRSSAVEEYRWHVTVPPAADLPTDAITPTTSRAHPLAPGSYRSLTVPLGGTARLTKGTYFFETIAVSEGGTLEIDNATGFLHVWVRRRLSIAGSMRELSSQPSMLLGYEGTDPPHISVSFHGTLVAPYATVSLPATEEPHTGAFFARAIQVADHAFIEHRTFVGWQMLIADPIVACRTCAVTATADLRRCCAFARAGASDEVGENGTDELARTEECIAAVVPGFMACEEASLLYPDACEKLDVGFRPKLSCGER